MVHIALGCRLCVCFVCLSHDKSNRRGGLAGTLNVVVVEIVMIIIIIIINRPKLRTWKFHCFQEERFNHT